MAVRPSSKQLKSKDFVEEDQVGLVLPNGRIVWPPADYKGRKIENAEDRAVMLGVLKASAVDLDWDEEEFLNQYRWASRHVVPDEVFPITHEALTTPPEGLGETNANGQH